LPSIINNGSYHIFCCNMFVFVCSIIAKSQCWLFDGAISGICAVVSKIITLLSEYKERWCIKICIRSYFNKINTFQHIGINFNLKLNTHILHWPFPSIDFYIAKKIFELTNYVNNFLKEFPLFNLQIFCFEFGFKNIPNNVDLYNDVRKANTRADMENVM
jgi:hypothetical protein